MQQRNDEIRARLARINHERRVPVLTEQLRQQRALPVEHRGPVAGCPLCKPLALAGMKRLPCCGGIYAHRATCVNHKHSKGGPRDCPECRQLDEQRATVPADVVELRRAA